MENRLNLPVNLIFFRVEVSLVAGRFLENDYTDYRITQILFVF